MVKQTTPSAGHNFLVIFLFHFLLFLYPLLSLLWRRSYPFLTVEVGAFVVLLAVSCGTLAYFLSKVRPAFVNILSSLLVTISFTLQFDFLSIGVILCTLSGLLVAWRLRANFQFYSLPILITLIIGAYFDSFEDEGYIHSAGEGESVNTEFPSIVHILVDGFIGLDGLPAYPESKDLSDNLFDFFENYQFTVFPRAYSRFKTTGNSLYSALNFSNDSERKFNLEFLGRRKHILESNSLFDVMQNVGYRFSIYQTGYLDFCQSNSEHVDRCWEYAQPNVGSIRVVSDLQTRVKMLLKVLVGQSTLISDLVVSLRWLLDQGVATHDPRVFARLESDVLGDSAGRYFFAHVLLPHGPYAFMHDCSIDYQSPLWARYANIDAEPVQRREIYEIRTMKYFEQIGCAVKSMRQIFDNMKAAGIYEQSIIVVHGDHGSGIGKYNTIHSNLEMLTPAEYRSSFSTLFALKFPGQKGLVDNRVLPLSTLLEEYSIAVRNYTSIQDEFTFMQALPESPEKVKPFIFLQGTNPMWKVDINIFED